MGTSDNDPGRGETSRFLVVVLTLLQVHSFLAICISDESAWGSVWSLVTSSHPHLDMQPPPHLYAAVASAIVSLLLVLTTMFFRVPRRATAFCGLGAFAGFAASYILLATASRADLVLFAVYSIPSALVSVCLCTLVFQRVAAHIRAEGPLRGV